jgi:hypothetical protein
MPKDKIFCVRIWLLSMLRWSDKSCTLVEIPPLLTAGVPIPLVALYAPGFVLLTSILTSTTTNLVRNGCILKLGQSYF